MGLTDTTVLYDGGQAEELLYYVALLNSTLLTLRFRYVGKLKSSGIIEYFWNSLSGLRVRRIDFQDAGDKACHDALVEQARHALEVNARLELARTAHDRALVEREAASDDRQIDRLVYELHGLTSRDVKTIESHSSEWR